MSVVKRRYDLLVVDREAETVCHVVDCDLSLNAAEKRLRAYEELGDNSVPLCIQMASAGTYSEGDTYDLFYDEEEE